jgi:hypothetical protein
MKRPGTRAILAHILEDWDDIEACIDDVIGLSLGPWCLGHGRCRRQ